jgi:hypothetical protein
MKNTSAVRPGVVLVALLSAAALVGGCGDVSADQGRARGAALVQAEAHVAQERAQAAQSERLTRQAQAYRQQDRADRALLAQSARLTAQAQAHTDADAQARLDYAVGRRGGR